MVQLIRRALPRPLRFLIRENSWMVKSLYQGRDALPAQEVIILTTVSHRFRLCWTGCHCYGESITHHMRGCELRSMIYQVCAFPPRTVVYLADAAAIKVRDIRLELHVFDLSLVYRK